MGMAPNEKREIRAARNQALFRAVNEKIRTLNEAFGELTGTFAVTCECSDGRCVALLEITAAAYAEVRASPHRFVVCPGHADAAVERVVEEQAGYAVVELTGRAAEIVEAELTAHPRRRQEV